MVVACRGRWKRVVALCGRGVSVIHWHENCNYFQLCFCVLPYLYIYHFYLRTDLKLKERLLKGKTVFVIKCTHNEIFLGKMTTGTLVFDNSQWCLVYLLTKLQIFTANVNKNSPVTNYIVPTVQARFVRIHPTECSDDGPCALRLDLLGYHGKLVLKKYLNKFRLTSRIQQQQMT